MNIIIVGCGRVGTQLAALFSESKNNVVVIDSEPSAFSSLGRHFEGRTLIGVGFDENVLLEAGIEECDVLAAVTNVDNSNLMIAEVGRKLFNVPHVLTRLYNPDRESAYLQLGLDYACGSNLVAEAMYSKVMAGHSNYVDSFGDYQVLRFSLDLTEDDKSSIKTSEIEREHEIKIIAFERKDSSQSSIPTKDSILYEGDMILACVRKDLLGHFSKYMQR